MDLEIRVARKLISNEVGQVLHQDCDGRGESPKILFLHGHPKHGQIHVYLSNKDDVADAGDIIGAPIDRVIDVPEWEEAVQGEKRVVLEDYSTIIAKEDTSDFDIAVGRLLKEIVIDDLAPSLGRLLPKRAIVMSENGDVYEDWNPHNG